MTNLSPNYYPGRKLQLTDTDSVTGHPCIVVIHMTEGEFSNAKGWLCNPASEASATRIFRKSGESVELVAESDAPWTNGFAEKQTVPPTNPWVRANCWDVSPRITPNLDALTIEVEWFEADGVIPVGSPLYQALAAQVATWCHKYDIPVSRERIMGHYEITPEEKPACGRHIPWEHFMIDVAAQVSILQLAATYVAPVAATVDTTVSVWASDAWAWARDTGINDGANPKAPVTEEQAMVFLKRFEDHLGTITNPILRAHDARITALENHPDANGITTKDYTSTYPTDPTPEKPPEQA